MAALKEYYDTRAPEYDEWYLGQGRFAERDRPGWNGAVIGLIHAVAGLPPARTLDVACGTAFLTVHLRGAITGLDQSEQMLAIARERVPDATFFQGGALDLPFDDNEFDRVFTGHFYGHLDGSERERFLT
jgi:ubiquinone/menaquinone biosynthesis C-methylase UbiE